MIDDDDGLMFDVVIPFSIEFDEMELESNPRLTMYTREATRSVRQRPPQSTRQPANQHE